MGETRVDLQHLLEDIRDAYPGSLEETIVTEIVANSLDSGASNLRIETDAAVPSLTVIDDGSGMARGELRRYHDIAASTKSRGEGIGFAGVGIKLGILASEDVFTETRRGQTHVASAWRLASRHKAPWKWVPPLHLVGPQGTAVRLRLRNPLSPLLESGFLETTLRRHFEPLFDAAFDAVLADHYPRGVRFSVNGRPLAFASVDPERAPLAVRLGRKRKPSAVGFLVHHDRRRRGPGPGRRHRRAAALGFELRGTAGGAGRNRAAVRRATGRGGLAPSRPTATPAHAPGAQSAVREPARRTFPRPPDGHHGLRERGPPRLSRAAASRAEGYHLALTVAMALAPLAVEPAEGHAFVTAFLARWGEAVERPVGAERRAAAGRRSAK